MSAEIVPWAPGAMLAIDEAVAMHQLVREAMERVLILGIDYGPIPGADRPVLMQPGSEKLLQLFGLGHELIRTETDVDLDGERRGVTYRAVVYRALETGERLIVSSCDGYAGYDEDRFYQDQATRQARENANAKKYKRDARTVVGDYRAPWHNVIMMAQKRALVGATRHATASSGLFTQDLEDQQQSGDQPAKAPRAKKQQPQAKAAAPPAGEKCPECGAQVGNLAAHTKARHSEEAKAAAARRAGAQTMTMDEVAQQDAKERAADPNWAQYQDVPVNPETGELTGTEPF